MRTQPTAESKRQKRKRDDSDSEIDYARITYHAPGRTFERLFKEKSLKEMKDVVRTKLGVASDISIHLKQLRGSKSIDLEDDDDFDAFRAIANSAPYIEVAVFVVGGQSSTSPQIQTTSDMEIGELVSMVASGSNASSNLGHEGAQANAGNQTKQVSNEPDNRKVVSLPSPDDDVSKWPEIPHKKKRKVNADDADDENDDNISHGIDDDTSLHASVTKDKDARNLPGTSTSGEVVQENTYDAMEEDMSASASGNTNSNNSRVNSLVNMPPSPGISNTQVPINVMVLGTDVDAAVQRSLARRGRGRLSIFLSDHKVVNDDDVSASSRHQSNDAPTSLAEEFAGGVFANIEGSGVDVEPHSPDVAGPSVKRRTRSMGKSQVKWQSPLTPSSIAGSASKSSKKAEPKTRRKSASGSDLNGKKKESKTKVKETKHVNASSISGDILSNLHPVSSATATGIPNSNLNLDAVSDHIRALSSKVLAAKRASTTPTAIEIFEVKGPNEVSTSKPSRTKQQKQTIKTAANNNRPLSPACPICLKSPLHVRYKCPVVLAGPEAIQGRILEIRSSAEIGQDGSILAELETFLRKSRKAKGKSSDTNIPTSSSSSASAPAGSKNSNLSNVSTRTLAVSSNINSLAIDPKPSSRRAGESASVTSSESSESDGETPSEPTVLPKEILYTDEDLEALVRGPTSSFRRVADVISPDSSEDENEDDIALEEEDDSIPLKRRSKKTILPGSSDEEGDNDDNDEDRSIDHYTSTVVDSNSPSVTEPEPSKSPDLAVEHMSFHDVNGLGMSVELDVVGDTAFGDAFAQDTAIFQPANTSFERPLVEERSLSAPASTQNSPNDDQSVDEPAATQAPSMESPAIDQEISKSRTPQPKTSVTPGIKSAMPGPNSSDDVTPPVARVDLIEASKSDAADIPLDSTQPVRSQSRRASQKKKSINPATSSTQRLGKSQSNQPPDASPPIDSSIARRTRTASRKLAAEISPPPHTTPIVLLESRRKSAVANAKAKGKTSNGKESLATVESNGAMDNAGEQNNSQETEFLPTPMSFHAWSTLKGSSPNIDADSSIMIDELHSSPGDNFSVGKKGPSYSSPIDEGSPAERTPEPENPLFMLTESQPPFPYSQWNSIGDTQRVQSGNESEDEEEVEASVKSKASLNRTRVASSFRKLTDIANQHARFFTPTHLRPAQFPSAKEKLSDLYGRTGQEEEDESESDSGSEAEAAKSHIPPSRIAGASKT